MHHVNLLIEFNEAPVLLAAQGTICSRCPQRPFLVTIKRHFIFIKKNTYPAEYKGSSVNRDAKCSILVLKLRGHHPIANHFVFTKI